jgi:hypothetical protein
MQDTLADDLVAKRRRNGDLLDAPCMTREPSCTDVWWSRIQLAADQFRPCGSFQSISGPLGTMPVGFTVSWLP